MSDHSDEYVRLEVVRFCAIECALQMSGEKSVAWMVTAWERAELTSVPLVHDDILELGRLVEPNVNQQGYRRVNVRVGSSVKPAWENVPALMTEFLTAPHMDPAEWFRQYEEIHPFRDGNGRTGAILYNLLRGTLDTPDWPPNFWNDPRRRPGAGAPLAGSSTAAELIEKEPHE